MYFLSCNFIGSLNFKEVRQRNKQKRKNEKQKVRRFGNKLVKFETKCYIQIDSYLAVCPCALVKMQGNRYEYTSND